MTAGDEVGHLHLAFVPDGERRAAGGVRAQPGRRARGRGLGAAEPGAAARQVNGSSRSTSTARAFRTSAAGPCDRAPAVALSRAAAGELPVALRGRRLVRHQPAHPGRAGRAAEGPHREELGERVEICGEERIAFPAPGVVAELEGLAGLPERKLATLRALAQAAAQGRSTASTCARWAARPRSRSCSACPASGPSRRRASSCAAPASPTTPPPRRRAWRHAAARAYGLDSPLPPTSWCAAARRGARTARGWASCCASARTIPPSAFPPPPGLSHGSRGR